jgi:hypothetical protein
MKKILSIISAILILVASAGLLLIPQLFELRIKKLEDDNETIISNQRSAMDYVLKANSSRLDYALFRDNLDLFKMFSKDVIKIREKETSLILTSASSALFALDASLDAKKINQNTYNSEREVVRKANDYDIHKGYYLKYIEIAGKGTTELDELRKQNVKKIDDLKFWKDALWYSCFFIQSIGFILAIIALTMETDN